MNPSNNIDFSNRVPMKPLPNGRYAIEPGEYYVVNSESLRTESPEDWKISEAIFDPSNDTDTWANKMVGGYIDGEPVYSTREHWSGVSNSFISKKLYDFLVDRGIENPAVNTPSVIVFTKPTTLGNVNGEPYEDNPDYGFMEVGEKKVDLFYGDDSIVRSERTVID